MSRKRILQVVHSLPFAGTEMLVTQISLALKKKFDFGVCCLDQKGPLAKKLEGGGIPVFELNRKPGRDWKAAKRFKNLIQTFTPDIIHAHQYSPFFYSVLAKTRNQKLIFTEHGRHFPDRVGLLRKVFNLWAQFKANQVTAVCDFSRKRLIHKELIWFRKIILIPNGVKVRNLDSVNVNRIKKELGMNSTGLVIGFVGRLHRVKNPLLLLQTFFSLAEQYPESHLLFIGSGELESALRKKVVQKKMHKRVTFAGSKYPVYSFYKAMDLLVLPSVSEGASVTLLEAMAAKVPVVASDVGGNLELIDDGIDGRIFESGNRNSLRKVLKDFLVNPQIFQEYAKKAHRKIIHKYQQTQMIDSYKRLYERLL